MKFSLDSGIHVPLLKQEAVSQGFNGVSHLFPVKSSGHKHKNWLEEMVTQVPFPHGDGSQGFTSSSQRLPRKPLGHVQLELLGLRMLQEPLFKQGFGSQGLVSS